MAGWDLKEGKLSDEIVSEDKFWEIINSILLVNNNKNLYKNYFWKTFIFFVNENQDSELLLDVFFSKFISIFKDKFIENDIVDSTNNKKSKLMEKVNIDDIENNKKMIEILKKYVLGATFNDSSGLLFGFSKQKNKLHINVIFKKNFVENYEFLMFLFRLKEELFLEKIKFRNKLNIENSFFSLDDYIYFLKEEKYIDISILSKVYFSNNFKFDIYYFINSIKKIGIKVKV